MVTRSIVLFSAMLFVGLAVSAEPPIYGHDCPHESNSLNRPCSGGTSHWDEIGDVCWTLRDHAYCPSGWEGLRDCVDEFGIRDCTPAEKAIAGFDPTTPCSTAYQHCGDGGRVHCSFSDQADGLPIATWQGSVPW